MISYSKVMTIGFTQTTAENFFSRLSVAGVQKVLDVRLHNTSQLAGFAKADDLIFFLRKICGIEYVHDTLLAPTVEMLNAYKKKKTDWETYERDFLALMRNRQIECYLTPEVLDGACLLCSEAKPHHCHRRLVVEYLNEKWDSALKVSHL